MILSQENKKFNTTGSHLQGRLKADFLEVVKSFGQPTIRWSIDDKVTREWNITFDLEDGTTTHATIYDYKSDVPAEFNQNWSIGGWDPMAATCVNAVIALDRFFEKEAI